MIELVAVTGASVSALEFTSVTGASVSTPVVTSGSPMSDSSSVETSTSLDALGTMTGAVKETSDVVGHKINNMTRYFVL